MHAFVEQDSHFTGTQTLGGVDAQGQDLEQVAHGHVALQPDGRALDEKFLDHREHNSAEEKDDDQQKDWPDLGSGTGLHDHVDDIAEVDCGNRHIAPDLVRAGLLSAVFVAMVLAWALISPDAWPFFMTAVIGVAAAAVLTGPKRTAEVIGQYDLKTLIVMVVILSVAAVVSVLGVVGVIANALVAAIPNSTLLLVALMTFVTIAAGLFSAGPATAAVLPIFITLSEGPLASFGDLTGVAFAASICAGSGMFMHSATAGPTLRGEVVKAGFVDADGRANWGTMS